MSASKNKLVTSITAYLAKVEKKIGAGSTPLIFQTDTVMPADSVLNFDIKPLFEDHALYDLRSVDVVVTLKDEDPLSKTKDFYINAEASITYGVNALGQVRLHNASTTASTVCVKISSPTVVK